MNKAKSLARRILEARPDQIAACALAAFGAIAVLVTATAIAESYSNLVTFGLAHGMRTWHGAIAPLAVDTFIVLGELMLFGGLLLHWHGKGFYSYAVFLAIGGFAMSVGGNIFRAVSLPLWADRAVQAIWPVTATAALTGCLIISKRLLAVRVPAHQSPPPAPAREPRTRAVRVKARVPGPAAAGTAGRKRAIEDDLARELAQDLIGAGTKLPGKARYARTEPRLGGSVRAAEYVLELARAGSNGSGHGGHDSG